MKLCKSHNDMEMIRRQYIWIWCVIVCTILTIPWQVGCNDSSNDSTDSPFVYLTSSKLVVFSCACDLFELNFFFRIDNVNSLTVFFFCIGSKLVRKRICNSFGWISNWEVKWTSRNENAFWDPSFFLVLDICASSRSSDWSGEMWTWCWELWKFFVPTDSTKQFKSEQ